ncbi:ABZJ_00895 family protein [Thioclava sp.]|uniref:ABZJ_00895 family protein n=1 Tax=Thioclava sp. TaxID=1933450 RepID=UPI003AA8CBCA
MKRYYWIYAAWFIGASIGLPILLEVVRHFSGVDLYSSFVTIAPAMVAAMVAGMSFVKGRETAPTSSESWRFARGSLVIALVFSMLYAAAFFAIFPEVKESLHGLFEPTMLGVMAVILAVVFLIIFLTNRIFFAMGAKNGLKAALRNKAKAG